MYMCIQDGTKCRNPVNLSVCRFCDYHVQSESKRINSNRGVLQDSSFAAKLNSQAEQAGGLSQSYYLGPTKRAV